MPMPAAPRLVSPSDLAHVDAAVRALLATGQPVVLAVSGGCDSMVLLHATHRAMRAVRARARRRPSDVTVVTFDHGTGSAATAASKLVVDETRRLGIPIHHGVAARPGSTESEWRSDRWTFFRSVTPEDAVVATAHTRDDQVETVVMRVLRGTGARGLAALAAPSTGVIRPFLRVARETVRRYAAFHMVPFVEDPSNESRRHFRNRVRHDLLPAIRVLRPRFDDDVVALAERAAALRLDVDNLVARFVSVDAKTRQFRVARDELATYDSAALCVLWPAIAARAGVTLDRRGTLRLAQFTSSGGPGARVQLSGGVEVYRHRDGSDDTFALRRPESGPLALSRQLPLAGVVEFGRWRFRPQTASANLTRSEEPETADAVRLVRRDDAWTAELPADRALTVREWRSGDRMRAGQGGTARRVKRFFGDARVPNPNRAGWPVVLADGEIVWIPGVRRVRAASERSGRPTLLYTCERVDGGPAYG